MIDRCSPSILLLVLLLLSPSFGEAARRHKAGWRDQHPQTRSKSTLRLPCYSCMSPYLEDHFSYLSNLYKRPASFTPHCNDMTLDKSYLMERNCSDMCVTLRISDTIGGRRSYGFMRGCVGDIMGVNHTVVRLIEERYEAHGRRRPGCVKVTPRSLFMPQGGRMYTQESDSAMELCGCFTPGCNSSPSSRMTVTSLLAAPLVTLFLLVYPH